MAVAKDTILGTDSVKDALKTKANDNFTDLYAIALELETARTSTVTVEAHASLDARLESIEASIEAGLAGDGSMVSANDSTPGYLNGKLLAGEGVDLTEGNDGGDETLTISAEDATVTNKGVASFVTAQFTVASGAVTIKTATTSVAGLIPLATTAEAITGTDAAKGVVSSALTEVLRAKFLL